MDRGLNIIFEWVPAHVGIVGNEKADINAKKSLQDSSINININLNYKEIGSLAESFIIKTWQEEWNTRRGSHHHNIQPLVNRPLITTLPTNKNKILTRLRVGVVAGLGDTGFKIHKMDGFCRAFW